MSKAKGNYWDREIDKYYYHSSGRPVLEKGAEYESSLNAKHLWEEDFLSLQNQPFKIFNVQWGKNRNFLIYNRK